MFRIYTNEYGYYLGKPPSDFYSLLSTTEWKRFCTSSYVEILFKIYFFFKFIYIFYFYFYFLKFIKIFFLYFSKLKAQKNM